MSLETLHERYDSYVEGHTAEPSQPDLAGGQRERAWSVDPPLQPWEQIPHRFDQPSLPIDSLIFCVAEAADKPDQREYSIDLCHDGQQQLTITRRLKDGAYVLFGQDWEDSTYFMRPESSVNHILDCFEKLEATRRLIAATVTNIAIVP